MIDLSQPPYNVRGDWNCSDATATDNWQAIQDAANAAAAGDQSADIGMNNGDTLLLPKGSFLISKPLVLPPGVSLQGSGDYASALVMKATFDPNSHFIDLGNSALKTAAFGNKIRNMNLWAPLAAEASPSTAMVFTNNVQDTDAILDGVRIYARNRRCFWGEYGYGGASIVKIRQVTGTTSIAGLPAFTFYYGESTMIYVDGLEPSCNTAPGNPNAPLAGTVGIAMAGGFAKFRRLHFEQVDSCMIIGMSTARCFCDIAHVTGGPATNDLFTINANPVQLGRIRLADIQSNGAMGRTVYNGQSGASPIYGDIVDPIRL